MKEPFIAPRFFTRSSNLSEDSWTYGSHRQYLCKRRDGAIQCVRISAIPAAIIMGDIVMMALLAVVFVATMTNPDHAPGLREVIIRWQCGLLALLIAAIASWGWFPLVVAVGPRQYNGKRVFWHEEKRK